MNEADLSSTVRETTTIGLPRGRTGWRRANLMGMTPVQKILRGGGGAYLRRHAKGSS